MDSQFLYIFFVFFFTTCSNAFLLKQDKYRGVGEPYDSAKKHGLFSFEGLYTPAEASFEQKRDHFNPTDETTWSQRYWRNPLYYRDGGPAFLMINGESAASAKWAEIGQWTNYAKENGAMCFLLEHRYYGGSRPANDTSTENLVYLSSEQALADAAYFIRAMNKKYLNVDTKWIVFGGSYAGSLAAWLRLKYPYLVYGAISSSGPLLAKIDFYEYFQVVRDSLAAYDIMCPVEVAAANSELDQLIASSDGRAQITKTFKLCKGLESNADDISSLFMNLADNFAGVVQYNKDNRAGASRLVSIDKVCDIMTGVRSKSKNSTALERLAEVNSLMLNVYNQSCLDHEYANYIRSLRSTKWDLERSDRQWIYQTCTEFGFYQTSSKPSDIFGVHFPAEFFVKQCEDIYGKKFNELMLENAVDRTNIIYGALDLNIGNIVYVHGSVDPWHALGILKAPDNQTAYKVLFIEGTAHCADMYPSSDNDLQSLKEARYEIGKTIRSWLRPAKEYAKNEEYALKVTYKYYSKFNETNFLK